MNSSREKETAANVLRKKNNLFVHNGDN